MQYEMEHPDRVAWYRSLIEDWTGRVPLLMRCPDGRVLAWVSLLVPLSPEVGWQVVTVEERAWTVERALETLSNSVYFLWQGKGGLVQADEMFSPSGVEVEV